MIDQDGNFGDKVDTAYTPMTPAQPIAKEDDSPLDLQTAASLVAERDRQEAPIVEVSYTQQNGANAGERVPRNETITAEQASADLNRWRARIVETEQALEKELMSAEIDALRSDDGQEQQPQ